MTYANSANAQVGEQMRAPKTAELIASHLRKQIVRGDLQEGDTLPSESLLMEQYKVSRPTLREAFRILETENLLTVRRGSRGGAQVMVPDISVASRYVGVLLQIQGTTIADVYEARMVFEPACAAILARRRTNKDLMDFAELIAKLESTIEFSANSVPEPVRWTRLTYRFHELIMERCGNKTLAVQGAVLQDIVDTHMQARIGYFSEDESPDRFQRAIKAYRKFVSLLEARDADRAERHWRNHMDAAGKFLLKDDLKNKHVVDLFS